MKNALCRPLLLAGFVLLSFSLSSQTPPTHTVDQSQPQAQTRHPKKLKIKHGGIQDIDAIGKRHITGWDWYSIASETTLGRQLAQQVDSQADFIQDPAIAAYVNRIGQVLVRNSDVQLPVTIRVVNSERPVAFALPGGFLYVNSGLILAADNEAQLAAAVAHAIAHVAARHVTRLMTRAQFINIAELPLIHVHSRCDVCDLCEQGQSIGLPISFLRFSRDFEFEADYLGVQYMYKAGYEPDAFVAALERLEALEGKNYHPVAAVFSAYPPTAQRIRQVKKEILAILPARTGGILNTPDFDTIKALVAALPKTVKTTGDTVAPQLQTHRLR
jgi:beta-barrel assembly-enhancing protease